jgi:hypothetical protein
MDGILFQDYITVSVGNLTVTQGAASWLDVSAYEDLVFFLDVKNGPPSNFSSPIYYQTSPTREDQTFLNMIAPVNLGIGLQTNAALAVNCKVPAATYLRWQIGGGIEGSFSATFRIVVAGYSLKCLGSGSVARTSCGEFGGSSIARGA